MKGNNKLLFYFVTECISFSKKSNNVSAHILCYKSMNMSEEYKSQVIKYSVSHNRTD